MIAPMQQKEYPSWEEAEKAWEQRAQAAKAQQPITTLSKLPLIPGVTKDTSKRLKWKSLRYMISHDVGGKIRAHVLKHPFRYGLRLLRSLGRRKAYSKREGDFFFYGLTSCAEFEKAVTKETLLVVGFSYCQKPLECPSGRFTDQCRADPDHPVCAQCFIGKVRNALPEGQLVPLLIPTIHYIGEKLFTLLHAHPERPLLFLITACELTLRMFGDYGNMAGLRGIGIRLDGRICNTFKAFLLSEEGIKPGLTLLTPETERLTWSLLRTVIQRTNF